MYIWKNVCVWLYIKETSLQMQCLGCYGWMRKGELVAAQANMFWNCMQYNSKTVQQCVRSQAGVLACTYAQHMKCVQCYHCGWIQLCNNIIFMRTRHWGCFKHTVAVGRLVELPSTDRHVDTITAWSCCTAVIIHWLIAFLVQPNDAWICASSFKFSRQKCSQGKVWFA